MQLSKKEKRRRRHRRVKKKILCLDKEVLYVYKSLKHIYAQVINGREGKVIFSVSSLSPEFKKHMSYGGNIKAASIVGKVLAENCKARGIKSLVFDRGGYPYHGRVASLAEAAREGNLKF